MPMIPKDSVEKTLHRSPVIGDSVTQRLGAMGGLTQFGVNIETLPHGARSSIKHWHAEEDEFVYLLSGSADLHEGDQITPMQPGDAACFPAGAPLGHCLEATSQEGAVLLIVGTRAAREVVTYPEDDCILTADRTTQTRQWTRFDGTKRGSPYEA